MSLVMKVQFEYFNGQANEKSRAGFCDRRPAAEPRARVAGRALAARPAVPARTPAVAPVPARDGRARKRHLRLSDRIAVLLPSLVLAWLAVRSLRDQQFLLERQQSLLCQRVTDALAKDISDYLAQRQQEFSAQVETLVGDQDARSVGSRFDAQIRQHWPLAEVGFCVTRLGKILSPSASARDEAKSFYSDNGAFLGNRETAEVYGNVNTVANNSPDFANNNSGGGNGGRRGYGFNSFGGSQKQSPQSLALANAAAAPPVKEKIELDSAAKKKGQDKIQSDQPTQMAATSAASEPQSQNTVNFKAQARKVTPQNESFQTLKDTADEEQKNLSRVIPAEGEFR